MKRLLSVLLSAIMVFSLFTFLGVTGVAAVTEISNSSPAITADVGETIALSGYSVVFDGDTSATTDITWKNASNATITSFKPTEKGVTKLTATKGSKSKTIYVVAKEADETEYVLYEADFSKYSNISELKAEGWNLLGASSLHKLSGGAYVLGSKSDGYARAILPAWLGDFGDYGITTNLKMLETTDSGRWVGVVYRIQNANSNFYPYLHMCAREATTSSGIEFAERTSGNDWNVVLKGSGEIASLKTAYNKFTVNAKGDNISYSINDSQVLFVNEKFIGKSVNSASAARYEKGMLGLTMNYGVVAFKSIKVTVQETVPEKEAVKLDLINNSREDVNLINPIANVEGIETADDIKNTKAGSVFVPVAKSASEYNAFVKACVENQKLATYYITGKDQADWLISAMGTNKCKDANAISDDPAILSYIRSKTTSIRTGLVLVPEIYESYNDIRVAVRSAPATFVVLNTDNENVTKELVMEIQEFAVAVWAFAERDADLNVIQLVTAGVNGIITGDAAKTAEIINKHLVDNAMTRTPIMIGHRGNPSQAPENTLEGFITAYENGADVFEVDVEITKDGHIVIMHDSTLNRTTTYTGTKSVNQMTLAEIKAEFILAKSNDKSSATKYKVPTLKEVLDEFKDKDCKIFVEFKGSNSQNVPATMKLLKDYKMEYLVDVISFNGTFLLQTQQNSTGMSTGFLMSGADNGRTPEDALTSLYQYIVTAQGANSTINPANGIMISNGNYFAKAVTDRGITVWPWTYTYNSNSIGFLSGCDGVTTDDMQWVTDMAKYLEAPANTTIAVGQQFALGATVVTYGNDKFTADGSATVASVVEGEDVVTVVDGKLVGLKKGTAEVILGYRTSTTTGGVYVVYTQPFTVTVENSTDALSPLVSYAKNAKRTDYLASVYEELTATLEEAEAVLASGKEATEAEISAVCVKLASLLNDSINKVPVSFGASYTTTAPNRGDGNTYNDDGKRLTDGTKASPDGGTNAYAGWNNGVKVEVIVDLGEIKQTNSYTIYGAYGFWGIANTKTASISISKDGTTYTDLGKPTYEEDKVNATTILYTYSIFTEELNEARYIKFTVTPNGNHTWIDEVEATVSSGADEPVGMLGDVNNDGKIDQYDYVLVKRHHFNTRPLTDDEATRADANKDGKVDTYDYLLIARHYFGTYVIK
ncbi:MAG: discoidin domain-containing protein [Clostridia bacterium]|nr:discoidin domain-containing protein [Clostridia bacterium]